MYSLILIHIITGLVGILCGSVIVAGIFRHKRTPRWLAAFLISTSAATITGFCFLPTDGVTSAQIVGFFTAALLGLASFAYYSRRLAGSWKQIYAMATIEALFLNVLITIAQSFQHIRLLTNLAPSQGSPAFILVKSTTFVLFLGIGFFAVRRGYGE